MPTTSRIPTWLRPALVVYVIVGVALWPIPLLNVLHAESSAVVAAAAFFTAGMTSLSAFREGAGLGRVLAWQEAALLVPWALLTLTVLWAPNCGYLAGLLFFVLFPGVTVILAVALAYLLHGTSVPGKGAVVAATGIAIMVLGPLYDLGFHPQFFTYNHVFGGVLGPIYDEELAVRPGLFWFRGLTLLWAALLVAAAPLLDGRKRAEAHNYGISKARGEKEDAPSEPTSRSFLHFAVSSAHPFPYSPFLPVALALAIVACYLFAAPLGINTPEWYLQQRLGGHLQTEHFDIYFDPASVTPEERRLLALDHEYRHHWLTERLGVEPAERTASYLYPNAEVKADLTGARYTSVAPVWLARPQSHVLIDRYDESFGHELVHVFSRRFGLPLVNASRAVGLVEGLAVALEPPQGRPTVHEQVSAAALQEGGDAWASLAPEVAARLSPFGFWTGRGAVSYTTMGSFVAYLIDMYGAERFREAYAWGDFERVYGRTVLDLAREWEAALLDLDLVARESAPLARARFSRPSLFEERCPHYVPHYRRAYRAGEDAASAGDTVRALRHFEKALDRRPAYPAALAGWADLVLARGDPDDVVARLDTIAQVRAEPALARRLADAYAMAGRPDSARALYHRARLDVPAFDFEAHAQLVVRQAVAGRADLVGVLVSNEPAEHMARRIDALPPAGPAGAVLRALLLADAGRYHEAAASLYEHVPALAERRPPAEGNILRVQRLVWLADLAYRGRDVILAEAYARAAARSFSRLGAHRQAARMDDAAARMRWVEEHAHVVGQKLAGRYGR